MKIELSYVVQNSSFMPSITIPMDSHYNGGVSQLLGTKGDPSVPIEIKTGKRCITIMIS